MGFFFAAAIEKVQSDGDRANELTSLLSPQNLAATTLTRVLGRAYKLLSKSTEIGIPRQSTDSLKYLFVTLVQEQMTKHEHLSSLL